GGILFYEYRTDDARLTIEVLKEAVSRGAVAINYCKALGFTYAGKKVSGVVAEDQLNGGSLSIHADYIVNASGPWVEELDALDQKQNEFKLRITKGVHLVVDGKKLPVKQSLYFDTFDKRMLFVIPREGKTYIGTTDTFYEGDKLQPEITDKDKNYILKCANAYFPDHQLKGNDIEACWAGLRPLIHKAGKSPSEISRKDELFVFPSGLITIAGGKLTGYRKMAQRVMDVIADKMKANGRTIPACRTDQVLLSGADIGETGFDQFVKRKLKEMNISGLTEQEASEIIHRYGSNCDWIFENIKTNPVSAPSGLPPALQALLNYAIEHELCASPSDFFIRRTGTMYFNIAFVKKWKDPVIAFMKQKLGWDEELTMRFSASLEKVIGDMHPDH
ncbi:MAG: glycerol-3-phosphate dehydrogenase/oxidase, partial [Bacteroidia bacterium]